MITGLLKSDEKPAGWGLPELLKHLLLELDAKALALAVEGDPRAALIDQLAGHVRIAYGLARGAVRPMRLVRGREREGLELVR